MGINLSSALKVVLENLLGVLHCLASTPCWSVLLGTDNWKYPFCRGFQLDFLNWLNPSFYPMGNAWKQMMIFDMTRITAELLAYYISTWHMLHPHNI